MLLCVLEPYYVVTHVLHLHSFRNVISINETLRLENYNFLAALILKTVYATPLQSLLGGSPQRECTLATIVANSSGEYLVPQPGRCFGATFRSK